MKNEQLEEILSCQSLPSLPAVALRVIELTSDPNVKLDQLADTIQNDQGLAVKILRTVNSSFYGLRTPCANINKALVMLGLGPVKALALGFSLVTCMNSRDDEGFDKVVYWRRGLVTGVAAKCIAEAAGHKWGDEAFLGGLLQDVGIIAMHRALGDRYARVLAQTGGDHRKLVPLELAAFEIQHPDIGAMLAQRWKLPPELVLPIRYHERPTAAPRQHADAVRCVGLANLIHDALTDTDAAPVMRRVYERAEHWFKLTGTEVDAAIRRIAAASKQMASLFKLDIGAYPHADAVLAQAEKQMLALSRSGAAGNTFLCADRDQTDPLTGALGRVGFDSAVRAACAAGAPHAPIALVQCAIDGFKSLIQQRGPETGDEILIGAAALLHKHFVPVGGVVCRIAGEIFAIVLVGAEHAAAENASRAFVADLATSGERWTSQDGQPPIPLSASLGIAAASAGEVRAGLKPEDFILAAVKSCQAARAAGKGQVRTASLKEAA